MHDAGYRMQAYGRRFLFIVFILAGLLALAGVAFGVWNAEVRLTDNSINDSAAEISGNNIVWQSEESPSDMEIVFYNGSVSTTLTSNNRQDMYPRIDGNQAVWWGWDGDWEIFRFDGSNVTTVTANDAPDTQARISGDNIVWERNDGNDSEIMKSNGTTETSVTDNSTNDLAPEVSGNNIVWYTSDGSDLEIMFYNGSNTTTLTANDLQDSFPKISGNNIAWRRHDGNDWEIVLYNGSIETTLTSNTVDDVSPVISGSNVAWQSNVSGNTEIMFYNGSAPTTISINPGDDVAPEISGDKVVWYNQNSPTRFIYVFDGAGTHAIPTLDAGQSPRISGNHLVWDTLLGGPDNEIYKYDFDYANPGDPGVTSAAPPKNVWTNDNTLLANFSGGSDPISGIDGYSVTWTGAPLTLPDAVKDLEESAGSALSPAQPDGDRYFHLRTRDNAGNWTSTIHYGPFKIDTVKPATTMRAPVNVSASGTTARFRVSWRGADAASGVKNYDVQYKVGAGGAWKRWKRAVTTVRARFTGAAGKTYFFRSRARDKAGNLGAWSRRRRTVVS